MSARWLLPLAVIALFVAAACQSDSGDSQDFVQFADQIARAVEDGDIAFFAERVEGNTHVCTAEEVEGSTGPDAPRGAICVEVGQEFEGIPISNFGTLGNVHTPEVFIQDIEGFFDAALSEAEDGYGVGGVRLFATAIPLRPGTDEELGLRTAILTSLQDFEGREARYVRAIDFELVGDRWVIRSELTGSFPLAVDLLSAGSSVAVYANWTAY